MRMMPLVDSSTILSLIQSINPPARGDQVRSFRLAADLEAATACSMIRSAFVTRR